MKYGNWAPLSKALSKYFPKNRPYSRIEAALSLQMDYDAGKRVTITGYSHLWRWSVGKVYRFLKKMNVQIKYPEDTRKRQNQNGMIMNMIPPEKRNDSGMIRLINSKALEVGAEAKRKENPKKTEGKQTTTIYPNPSIKNSCQERTKNPCPYDHILDLYHTILAELPRVRKLTERRRGMLAARWNEKARSEGGLYSNTLEFWEAFFKYINQSKFLMGRKTDFRANFEWIVTKRNFNKIIEGTYHSG